MIAVSQIVSVKNDSINWTIDLILIHNFNFF